MIRVRIELLPGGIDSENNQLLGEITISNDIHTTLETKGKRATYNCVIYKKRRTPWKRVKVKNFPRESYHPWEMVRQILNKAAEQNGGRI